MASGSTGRASRRQFAFGRRHQHLGGEGGIVLRAVPARRPMRGDIIGVALGARAGHFQHDLGGQRLARFPAVESVAVAAHQHGAVRARCAAVLKMAGAEKPRPSDSSGSSATSTKTKRWHASRQFQHAAFRAGVHSRLPGSAADARRSAPTRPMRTGICMGCFSGWPGVGARLCVRSSV